MTFEQGGERRFLAGGEVAVEQLPVGRGFRFGQAQCLAQIAEQWVH